MKKFLKISIVSISLVLMVFIFNEIMYRKLVWKIISRQQSQTDQVVGQLNNLLNNDITLLKNIRDNKIESLKIMANSLEWTKENIILLKDQIGNANIQKMLNSSVFVQGIEKEGSGTVIKKTENNMYILTCYHVASEIIELNEQGQKVGISVGYTKTDEFNKVGRTIVYGAEIINYDKEKDLALLRTNIVDDELEEVSIAEAEPEKGEIIYSVGNPLGLLRTISKGILANKIDGFFISENVTTFGNSGCGLYNKFGELIGVPAQVLGYGTTVEGNFVPESSLGFSRDLNTIKNFLGNFLNEL